MRLLQYFKNLQQFASDKIAPLFVGKKYFSLVGVVLLVAGLPVVLLASRQQTETKQHAAMDAVPHLLPQVAQMQNQARLSGQILRAEPNADLSLLINAAKNHSDAMQFLIQNDPDKAISEALTTEEKQKLPDAVQPLIEDLGGTSGTVEVIHGDNFKNHASQENYQLVTSTGIKTMYFAKGNIPEIQPNSTIAIARSVQLNATMALNPSAVTITSVSNAQSVTGNKNIAVVLVKFTDDSSPSIPDVNEILNLFLNGNSQVPGVASFFNNASFNQLHFNANIRGWYTINNTKHSNGECNFGFNQNDSDYDSSWIKQIQKQTNLDPYNTTYNHVVYILLKTRDCTPYPGIALLGNKVVVINGIYDTQNNRNDYNWLTDVFHELGHNLGLVHAFGYRCYNGNTPQVISDNCTGIEYGDPFDIMGYGGASPSKILDFNNYEKAALKWLTKDHIQDIPPNTNDSFNLYPVEKNQGITALRIPYGQYKVNGKSINGYYYIEYRQPVGNDSAGDAKSPIFNGITIRLAPDITTISSPYLYDLKPDTLLNALGFLDAPLLLGRQFYDPDRNLSIMPVPNQTSDYAIVQIAYKTMQSALSPTPTPSPTPTLQGKDCDEGYGICTNLDNAKQVLHKEVSCKDISGANHPNDVGILECSKYPGSTCCSSRVKIQNIPPASSNTGQSVSGGINATLVSGITPVGSCVGIIERGTTAADYNNQNASSFNAHPNPNIPSEKALIDTNSWPHWPILYASGGCVKTWCTNGNLYADFTWPTGYTNGNAEKNYSLNLWMSSTRHGSLVVGNTQNTTLQFDPSDAGALVDASISNAYGETGWPITYLHLATCNSSSGGGGGGGGVKTL